MQHASQGLAIRRVPLDSLHTDPANARAHGDENMAAIAASLQRFGQAEPLVVQKPTDRPQQDKIAKTVKSRATSARFRPDRGHDYVPQRS